MTEKVNILYISRTSKLTGAEYSLLDVLKKINKELFNPIVALPDREGIFYKNLMESSIETLIVRMPFLRLTYNPFLLLWFFLKVVFLNFYYLKILKKHKIRLVVCNSFQDSINMLIPSMFSGLKVIIHIKNIFEQKWKKYIRTKYCNIVADKIIAVSKAAFEDFMLYSRKKSKTTIIYDGIDYINYRKNLSNSNVLDRYYAEEIKGFNIISVGNLSKLKGQHLLIDAMSSKILKDLNIRVFLIGDIFHENDLPYKNLLVKKISENHLGNRVFLLGRKNDVADFINSCDILIHCPAQADAFPRVILEAFSLGKIVIATNVGGIPEIIKNEINGFLSKADSSELYRIIYNVCSNFKKLDFIRKNAVDAIVDKFNIDLQVEAYENIYKKILNLNNPNII